MNTRSRIAALLAVSTTSSVVLAHDGHGAADHHWHATDLGFLLVMALVIAAVILGRRK